MYFTPQTDPHIDWVRVDRNALQMLEKAREIAGIAFIVTSNYRTPEHSEAVGGFATDAHTQNPCSAFDIACADSASRWKIVFALKEAGFPRIGINTKNNHVHCDCDATKPQFVLFEE